MTNHNIVVGLYQNLSTAKVVIKELQRQGYCRIASIQHINNQELKVKKYFCLPRYLSILFTVIFILLIFLCLYLSSVIANKETATLISCLILVLPILGLLLASFLFRVNKNIINKLKKTVFIDEVLIIVEAQSGYIKEILTILRHVKAGHPMTFLLQPDVVNPNNKKVPLSEVSESGDRLRQEAISLAHITAKTEERRSSSTLLLKELHAIEKKLHLLREEITKADFIDQTAPSSTEWFLDNSPIIQESIEEIKRNLPRKYYKELPKVIVESRILPRIYVIASSLVRHTSGRINKQNITEFISSYQTITPLTCGELWAFPLMLKFSLLEWVQSLAILIAEKMHTVEQANFWGNRLLQAAQRLQGQLPILLEVLSKEVPNPSPLFAEELVDHLFDEEEALKLTKKWLETKFKEPLSDIFHLEQVNESLEQLVFSNSMVSLFALAQITWQEVVEELSPVDAILKEDPDGTYCRMDFSSRNTYRETIEQLSKHSTFSEVEIAGKCLSLAQQGKQDFSRHVGYYLIDKGRPHLEKSLSYSPPFKQSLQRFIKDHATVFYLGTIGLLTLVLEAVLFAYGISWQQPISLLVLLGLFALIPISEIAIQLTNFALNRFLPIFLLPKMSYKEGIPQESKTLVIIPTILTSLKEIQEEVEHLEIRHLANMDSNLLFGLFSDFKDSSQQHSEEDQALLDQAIIAIKTLDEKYGPGKFFLFHRQREWSKSENAWIGWERKRGKLEYLNRYLIGETVPENILYFGQAEALKGIRYVITLDADTQLAKNQAKKLIEIISHPLNKPILKKDGRNLERGYTIIQPIVCTDFPHTRNSLFLEIFSDPSVIDPYTHAVSNVYQDLTGEAAYHGKGIYDLKAFHSILTDRYPVEKILSHDLIEGAYVRVGFTGAVCLFDLFPENYLSYTNRQRRWIRGDWQILDWLFPNAPANGGPVEKNPLSVFNRWKIFDNLRRSLLSTSLIALFAIAWLFAKDVAVWTALGTLVMFFPAILQLLGRLFKRTSYLSTLAWREVALGFERAIVNTSLLPQDAYFSLDSITRVFYRKFISHRQLLEWTTSKLVNRNSAKGYHTFLINLSAGSVFAFVLFLAAAFANPSTFWIAGSMCFLWMIAPIILKYIDKPLDPNKIRKLSEHNRRFLRNIARKTWRYFDDFVGPETNWLPPDNYQTSLNIGIAPRTSPTNIGFWLISVLNAYDMKYISCDRVLEKIDATIKTLQQLEKYEGHFLNWYDINTAKPLYPRYISTVDSGNLLACFWTMQQGLHEICHSPLIRFPAYSGLEDTLHIIINNLQAAKEKTAPFKKLLPIWSQSTAKLSHFIATVHDSLAILQDFNLAGIKESSRVHYWVKALETQLNDWEELILRYFKWVPLLTSLPDDDYRLINVHAKAWVDAALDMQFSLKMLADGHLTNALHQLIEASKREELPIEIRAWSAELRETIATTQWLAGEKMAQCNHTMAILQEFSENMNLGYLYNRDRRLFAIGYNVDEMRLDRSYYDLLASEARLASLVAIAKDEVPLEHWWALGRPYGLVGGQHVLLSWGGTMFEYLMPVLFNKFYPDSLLGNGCEAAVDCQIQYGKSCGIPWGISEAAYSAIDAHKIYQYRSFGVLGLGLKRGLEKDLVVSPYSTLLALAIKPQAAIDNLYRLKNRKQTLWGQYGFYESIDFTRQGDQHGERGVVIHTFMAHHQGMSFTAINNILHDDVISRRFHADPRISGVEFLLFERLPVTPSIAAKSYRKEGGPAKLKPFSSYPIMGMTETPNTAIPKINILSNHKYSVMLSNAGGGYSQWGDFDITRWRSDATCDQWGSFYYIKDSQSQQKWSAAFQPTLNQGEEYSSSFKADKAEFRRKDNGIETITKIVVSPEDSAEIRIITLINKSNRKRKLEITSYQELVLATHAADVSHPAFNKLFIETEAVPELNALIAFRRLRSPDDASVWVACLVARDNGQVQEMEFETNRLEFIGRGRSLQNPIALERSLTKTTGTVLDPIFSLRCRVELESGKLEKLSFVTLAADSRAQLLVLIEKYKHFEESEQAAQMAWTYSQLELRHLSITLEDAQLFQKLASRILYPHKQLRASLDRLESNTLGQSHLWKYGISGDYPIVVVSMDDVYDIMLVKQMLIAHAFWRLKGLKVDLVILNEEEIGYENPLQDQLLRLIQAYAFSAAVNSPGGVFLRNINSIAPEDLTLILSVARAFLIAARGSLRQQLVSPMPATHYPPQLTVSGKKQEYLSPPLPFMELPYFNGLGGYSPTGKTYAIYLGPDTNTPAPWINVIANPQFGTLVSEAGNGATWYGNSQSNRLTCWSNDPIVNPITDVIYIRDEITGVFWTPTPAPIRELDAYRVIHGQGYTLFEHNSHGIEQELLVLVPMDDTGGRPLRIQKLKLRNTTETQRKLTVTAYQDIILGKNKEETQMHVMTDWDAEERALLAYNHYNDTFGNYVAFVCSEPAASSHTGDRTEFIGRNGLLSNPAALKRISLSNHTGAGYDPCAALQVSITLNPYASEEILFILGYASDKDNAKRLIAEARNRAYIDQLIANTHNWWDTFLDHVQVDVQDLIINFALNRWLPYQNLSCRFWGRTAFYQSSGAYGFRDQLQDVMALLYSRPAMAREHIIRAAARQFIEGDVQHWWDPVTGSGVRTRFSDDLLWLPFTTAHYVRTTGDSSILEEQIPFLEAPLLEPNQHEVYTVPGISKEKASLLEHCRRAIKKGMTAGPHGLPLIGGGDWNDGMNRVGIQGKGESVWLAWFLIRVLKDFTEILADLDVKEGLEEYVSEAERLAKTVESAAWDGAWYRRAYYDNGAPLGSKDSGEATIDSLAQSWSVISQAGDPERSKVALQSAYERLVKVEERLVLLLTPPFDKTHEDPGYIKGYPPGVRENGGQYTHGSLWLAMAYARIGDGNTAVELLRMMHPYSHTHEMGEIARYKVEPYVLPGDVYDLAGQVGRGGWSWYSGSSAWMYRIWLEEILGFKLRGNKFTIDCAIPKEWDGFTLRYRHGSSLYEIIVENPHHVSKGTPHVVMDNIAIDDKYISLVDDGKMHRVRIILDKVG